MTDEAEIIIVAYGTPSRVADTAAENLRSNGIKTGVFRPVTLWPSLMTDSENLLQALMSKRFLTVEMSMGQMLDDVKLAVAERKPVSFYGRTGGVIPTVSQVVSAARKAYEEVK